MKLGSNTIIVTASFLKSSTFKYNLQLKCFSFMSTRKRKGSVSNYSGLKSVFENGRPKRKNKAPFS